MSRNDTDKNSTPCAPCPPCEIKNSFRAMAQRKIHLAQRRKGATKNRSHAKTQRRNEKWISRRSQIPPKDLTFVAGGAMKIHPKLSPCSMPYAALCPMLYALCPLSLPDESQINTRRSPDRHRRSCCVHTLTSRQSDCGGCHLQVKKQPGELCG